MSSALREGVLLGRYRLIAPIGEGSMGSVWRARNESVDREFALKLMKPEALGDPLAVQRFLQEARTAGKLRHRGIAEVYDVGDHEGDPYLVMELLEGESLDRRIASRGRLSASELVPIVCEAARALSFAHASGIVHRDVKPANLFLHRDPDAPEREMVKIVDFGVSKLLDPALDAGLTRTGAPIGTPTYMSPEQARGDRDIDARTDVWALGVVLYLGLSGELPFSGPNRPAIVRAVLEREPIDLASRVPGLAPELASIVAECLRKDPAERPADAATLADRLERVSLRSRTRGSYVWIPIAAFAVAAIALTMVLLLRADPDRRERPASPGSASTSATTARSSEPPPVSMLPAAPFASPIPAQDAGVGPRPIPPHPTKKPDRPRDPGF